MKTRAIRIKAVLFQLEGELLRARLSEWDSLLQAVHRRRGADGAVPVMEPDRRQRFLTSLNGTLKEIMEQQGLDHSDILICISDPDLMSAAVQTGCRTVAFGNFAGSPEQAALADFRAVDLTVLKKLVRLHTALPTGKLPNDLLREFLDQIIFEDPAVIVNPGVGEDIAAVDIHREEVLVLKSDPITFATDAIGRYLVLVNANDIATSGARPRWLLTTLMFPSGVTPAEIKQVVSDLERFCHKWDITLCGGHTEITDAVNRPVVAGMMAGTVARSALIEKGRMGAGDSILVTKAAAVEGTAIIAREFEERLRSCGMDQAAIESCKRFLDRIAIIPEARIAAASPATTAMHDVTEGGIATALEELSIAGGHRLKLHLDRIPVYPETSSVCALMGINPLGLIGSGSLLITCRQENCRELIRTISSEGIQVTRIGEVLERGSGIEAVSNGKAAAWPRFEVDEIARLF
jgi:hydrogenase maturation factor